MTLRGLWLRMRAVVAPDRAERDLLDELDFHLAREAHEQMAAGATPADARAKARRRFGSPAAVADACREVRGAGFADALRRDASYALRGFRQSPGFALTVIGTIALGLGLAAAAFIVFNRFALRVDRVNDPASLVSVVWPTSSGRSGRYEFNVRQYEALVRETTVFSDAAARILDIETRVEGRMASVHLVSGNYFRTLGVDAARGRLLEPGDDRLGGRPPVVLSHAGWQRLFGGDPDVIGRTVPINGRPFTVVGVTREGFLGLDAMGTDLWAPISRYAEIRNAPGTDNPGSVEVIGRLRAGVSRSAAQAAMAAWAASTVDGRPARAQGNEPVRLESHGRRLSASSVAGFSPLFIAFGLILLTACANAATLLVARGLVRQREVGIRLALGASRTHVVRQLVVESLLLAGAAAVGGILVARLVVNGSVSALFRTMPPELVELVGDPVFEIDAWVVGFVIATAVLSTLLFGLLPALQTTRLDLVRAARGENGQTGRPHRLKNVLVVVQVTASAFLLVVAGVFLTAAVRSAATDPGVRVDDTLIIENSDPSRRDLVQVLLAEPAVAGVAATWPGAPLVSRSRSAVIELAAGGADVAAGYRMVSASYFDLTDLPVIAGRSFTTDEAEGRAGVALVSARTAAALWPGGTPLGQVVRIRNDEGGGPAGGPALATDTFVVIGVVRDAGHHLAGFPEPDIYLPIPLHTPGVPMFVRVTGDPATARREVVDALTAVDPNVGMVFLMRTVAAIGTYPFLVVFWLAVVLGGIALMLATSGLFGVLSYFVAARRHEIGVRRALGATERHVMSDVGRRAALLAGVGLCAGVTFAWLLAALVVALRPPQNVENMGARLAHLIHPFDPVAYLGSAAVIAAAALTAALVPAMRAARVNPAETLRHDRGF